MRHRLWVAILFMALSLPPRIDGRADPEAPDVGVIVMAHGGDESWNRQVEEAIAPLRPRYAVEIAFGMAECSTLQTAVDRLEAKGAKTIVVIRLFLRSESFRERIEYLLGLRRDPPGGKPPPRDCCVAGPAHEFCTPVRTQARIVLGPALDGDPLLAPILVARAEALSRHPKQEAVLLLSHGLGEADANDRLRGDMERMAEAVRASHPYARVAVETLREDWPEERKEAERRIGAWFDQARANGWHVILVPYRVAGFGPYREVLRGRDYTADEQGLLPHANVAAWIAARIQAALAQ